MLALGCTLPTLTSAEAAADEPPSKERCATAFESTQRLRRNGELVAARKEALVCLDPVCPTHLRSECEPWLAEIDRDTPTVVVVAKDVEGRDLIEVQVTVDGKPLLDRIHGRAQPIDPGEHDFVFVDARGRRAAVHVLLAEGRKGEAVVARFGDNTAASEQGRASGATPADAPRRSMTLPLTFGAISLVSLASFTTFGFLGKSRQHDLERPAPDGCSPNCTDNQTAPLFREYLVADISLLVALVSAGVATWFLVKPISAKP